MAEVFRLANAGVIRREIGDWVETETAKDIQRSLDLVRASERPALTMIAGVPGVGKTMAVKRFCEKIGHDAIYIQAACGEGTAWNFARALSGLWNYSMPVFNTLAEARLILSGCIGRGRLLVVDEAQYLHQRNNKNGKKTEAFEWLRATAETGQFSLVYVGDLNLPAVINMMPQLQSRMLRPVIVKEVCRADVAAFVADTAFSTEPAVNALHAVARLKGGLRNVENVTWIARLFAASESPTLNHLRAAIADMKLAPKGGQNAT